MKEIKELKKAGLTSKQRLAVWYFALSLSLLCLTSETIIWITAILVLNFANSAMMVSKIKMPKSK